MTPISSIDLARLRRLIDVVEAHGANAKINIWADDTTDGKMFVNVQLTGHVADVARVKEVFALPIDKLLVMP